MASLGYPISGMRCESKIKNLKQAIMKTIDHYNTTGNDKKTCPFFEELCEIFGMIPTVDHYQCVQAGKAL